MFGTSQDASGVHTAAPERRFHHIPRVVLAEGAENTRFCPELRGGHGLVDGLAAHVQGAGFGAEAGGGDRLRIKAADDRVHQRRADTDQVKAFFHGERLL